jgi:alpha-D-ribose 1-methylphosphonate 5-triphosphate diphosphatase
MTIAITGGRVLTPEGFIDAELHLADGVVTGVGRTGRGLCLNARGLLVLPGIVDVHGDAFERQLMPRPGVAFAPETALLDTDRQAVANGITTMFHGVTRSWEPGLRGAGNARAILAALEALRGELAADTRFHLRHEIFNLEDEGEILGWLAERRIGALAFNDHMAGIVKARATKAGKLATMIARSGLSADAFMALVDRVDARRGEVSASVGRLAGAARQAGVPLLSHDDASADERRRYRALGCRIAEFPMSVEAAREAVSAAEHTVFGAPNVLRGGSHTGCPAAADMVGEGLCTVLASDYYFPALAVAPFRLAADGVLPFERAWPLVSRNPAHALGLDDRGEIAPGLRADILLVDPTRPSVRATIVAGRLVHLADGTAILDQ